MPLFVLMAVLAAAPAPIHLQALTVTSGNNADALSDGTVKTGWKPDGDAADEGALLRFETPWDVGEAGAITVNACGGQFTVIPFVNGRERPGLTFAKGGVGLDIDLQGIPRVNSVFLRIASAPPPKDPCLSEVIFTKDPQTAVEVRPPRRVPGKVQASSTLSPAPAYHPSYLFDGRLDFGWVEGAKGNGEGESVTVELSAPLKIAALEIWNGYQRSKVHYEKNARAKKVSVSLDDGPAATFDLKDVQGSQKLPIASPKPVKKIRLGIVSAYKGTKYPDLVISELRFWDAEGPVTVETPDRAELQKALVASVAGTALAPILGRHLSNECAGPVLHRTLKLRPDHTFVAYSEQPGSMSEVLDGTWVLSSAGTPWAEIEIYGRRHRVDEEWDPYADRSHVTATDAIAGGKIRIAKMSAVTGEDELELATLDTGDGSTLKECEATKKDLFVVRGPPLTDFFIYGP